jgi:hypothetical protein
MGLSYVEAALNFNAINFARSPALFAQTEVAIEMKVGMPQ